MAPVSSEHYAATAQALDQVTDQATSHSKDPKTHLHQPADHETSHHFLKSLIPSHNEIDNLENRFHLGNYAIIRGTDKKEWEAMSIYVRLGMHALYYGAEQEKVLESNRVKEMLKAKSEKMGKEYDSPASVDHIEPFIKSFDLGPSMKEMVQPDPKQYKTFNEFFAREIREDARPPAEPQNPSVVSSVADCRLTTFPTIDLATQIWVKGAGFTLPRLLDNDSVAQQFDGGSIAIHRLAPQDYHRWHAPVDGVVESIHDIPGAYYTVNPQAINESGILDVFCENKRSVMIVKRKSTGKRVAIVAVGAMLVGSIVYNPGVQVGAEIHRGQCLGKFQYGGSTVIAVFPPGELQFDADLIKNSTEQKCETLVQVGWRIGA